MLDEKFSLRSRKLLVDKTSIFSHVYNAVIWDQSICRILNINADDVVCFSKRMLLCPPELWNLPGWHLVFSPSLHLHSMLRARQLWFGFLFSFRYPSINVHLVVKLISLILFCCLPDTLRLPVLLSSSYLLLKAPSTWPLQYSFFTNCAEDQTLWRPCHHFYVGWSQTFRISKMDVVCPVVSNFKVYTV